MKKLSIPISSVVEETYKSAFRIPHSAFRIPTARPYAVAHSFFKDRQFAGRHL
jgi:hypothetical protein